MEHKHYNQWLGRDTACYEGCPNENARRKYIHELAIGDTFQYQEHGPSHTLIRLHGTRATETCSPGCTSTLPSDTLVIPL